MSLRHLPLSLALIASALVGIAATAETADAAGGVTCNDDRSGTVASETSDGFNPITPLRLVDTREGFGGHTGKVAGGCRIEINLDDYSQIPQRASAVALSVIAVDASQRGFLTAFPCDAGRPATSNVNPRPNIPTPNQTITPVGPSRKVCVFTNVATNIVVDATGWFGKSGAPFQELEPVRALDTRTVKGAKAVPAKSVVRVSMAGKWVPKAAKAVTVNFTITGPEGDGWALAFPCDTALPTASSVNYVGGEDRAGTTTVGLGPTGELCLYSNRSTHMVLDVNAWYGGKSPSALTPLTGLRLVDSRSGIGGWTSKMTQGETRSFELSGPGINRYSHAAVLNIIATEPSRAGHLRVFPCDQELPTVSIVNFEPGDDATNLTVTPTAGNRRICVFANAPTHVVIDTFGTLGTGSRMANLTISGRESYPDAESDANDYAVRCGAGQNNLKINATPSPGVTVAFGGDIANGPSPRNVVMVPNDLARVTFADATGSENFYIRCLPPNFPANIIDRPGNPAPGYYTVSHGILISPAPSPPHFVAVIDDYGVPLWYKTTSVPAIGLHRRPNGDLSWFGFASNRPYGVDANRGWEIHGINGSLKRVVKTVGNATTATDHHELLQLANGNDLAISYKLRTGVNLTVLGMGTNQNVVDLDIQEVRPNGTRKWRWNSKDHIDTAEAIAAVKRTDPNQTYTGNEVDLVHANSVQEAPNGDLIVSVRGLNAVIRINRQTGKIVWKLGGTAPFEPGAKHLAIKGDPFGGPLGQHDARLVGNRLSMYDNQYLSPGTRPSRGLVYRLNTAAGTATMIYEHRNPRGEQSFGLGSMLYRSDGSAMIGWGARQPIIEELNAQQNRTFSFTWQSGGAQYRAHKYPLSAFDAQQLRNNAGGNAPAS
jgi:hypothetical protein